MTTQELLRRAQAAKPAIVLADTGRKNEALLAMAGALEESTDAILEANGKPALAYYDTAATTQYLVDPNGSWSSAAAQDYMTTVLSAYSEANGNMVELVIANNDDMGLGAITALETAGYNNGTGTTIPVFTVDGLQGIVDAISAGKDTGAVGQSASGLAESVATLVKNYQADGALMSNTGDMIVDSGVAKIRVPYTTVS